MQEQSDERSASYWGHVDHLAFEMQGILRPTKGLGEVSTSKYLLLVNLPEVDLLIYLFVSYLTVRHIIQYIA
jgi:hypothetical protein